MKKFESFCPVRDVLSQIGDKWSVLAMVSMQKYGVCRFRDFQKDLERYNLVSRKVYPEVPPRVEYSLTKLGESFLSPMNNVINWILDNKEILFRSSHHTI